jgi:hypothetical protein
VRELAKKFKIVLVNGDSLESDNLVRQADDYVFTDGTGKYIIPVSSVLYVHKTGEKESTEP